MRATTAQVLWREQNHRSVGGIMSTKGLRVF